MRETSTEQLIATEPEVAPAKVRRSIPARAGAIGKALIAYLATGSLGVAHVVFLIFKGIGC